MSNDLFAPGSHNLCKAVNIHRSDTGAAPSAITSMTATILDSAESQLIAATTGAVVTGESENWSAEVDDTGGATTHGNKGIVKFIVVADSKTRVKYIAVDFNNFC